MKFMLISYATTDWEAGLPPDPRLLAAMPRLYENMPKAAALVSTGGLAPSSVGAKVRVSGGKVVVTDGPFAETKEIVGGFAIVDVSSKEEAIAIAKGFWQLHLDVLGPSYEGGGEIRQLFHQEECAPPHEPASASDSAQVAVVRRLYDARCNPEIIRQVLAPAIRWEVVEGFPYSGVYVGLDYVLRNFLGRLFHDFDIFVAVGTELLESGYRVIALGSYTGRAKSVPKEFTARSLTFGPCKAARSSDCSRKADTVQLLSCIGRVVSGGRGPASKRGS